MGGGGGDEERKAGEGLLSMDTRIKQLSPQNYAPGVKVLVVSTQRRCLNSTFLSVGAGRLK